MEDQRLENKIQGTLQFLEKQLSRTLSTLQEGTVRKAEYINPAEYRFQDKRWQRAIFPLTAKPGETLFFRGNLSLSAGSEDSQLYLKFDFTNAEGLFFFDNKPCWGIDIHHNLVPLFQFRKKSNLDFEVEFYFPVWPCFDPKLPHLVSSVELIAINPVVFDCYHNLKVAFEIWEVHTRRGKKVLEGIFLSFFRALNSDKVSSITAANRILEKSLFSKKTKPRGFSLALAGHSHIDTAWLWTIAETMRKCGRTFSTALRLMESDPKFIFSVSQPQQYQFTKDFYPDLYRQIKEKVAQGRWEPVGGFWVEPDCNLISGESFVRQILYGKKFFKEEFGKEVHTAWLPDVFGFAGSMPQILKEAGIDYFYTNKLYWESVNRFPHNLFWWKGIDGSKVLAHVPKLYGYYGGFPSPDQFQKAEAEFRQKANFPECLFPFGYGDGGGGVSLEQLAYARRMANFPNLPKSRYSRVEDYFQRAVIGAKNLPVWSGELYLETHQGCYTSQAKTKKNNRTAENLFYILELLQGLNSVLDRENHSHDLSELWKKVLTFQFHDILPGSSIADVYRDIEPQYEAILSNLDDGIKTNLQNLAAKVSFSPDKGEPVLLFNPLNWERHETVEIKPDFLIEVDLPPCGYRVYYLPKDNVADTKDKSGIIIRNDYLENKYFSLTFNRQGRITRLFDKVNHREVIPPKSCGNDFLIFKDGPLAEEAWNIDPDYETTTRPFGKLASRKIIGPGPKRAVLRQIFKDNESTIFQDVIIYENSRRIDFRTEVDWQERRKMLKVAFPVNVKSKEAFYEIPFGAISRPTTNHDSWEKAKKEVAALRWADLSDKDYGVSLLNDCKYGYDIKGNVMRLTLLRAPTYPDPEADKGRHAFTYSLFPHKGDWRTSGVVKQGYQLNQPVLVVPLKSDISGKAGLPEFLSLIKTEGLPVVVSAFKKAEDGQGFVLRLYEPNGRSGKVKVNLLRKPKAVWETGLLEEKRKERRIQGKSFIVSLASFKVKTFYCEFLPPTGWGNSLAKERSRG